jgi:radical SAM superfamily enzyme YgiQ (UPF0313 family)
MADIVLINPRFEVSFWGLEHALPLVGKRANLPVAALPLLAALTPPGHQVTLVDENVEPIPFDRLARADIVGVTGMIVQRRRMREILARLKELGCFTVVGGPWVTAQEDYFGSLADVIFVGEAEQTWPAFLDDWQRNAHRQRYEQDDKTDMTRVPTPRFDLLKMQHYLFGSVQFTRGCPYQCEFCDIIVTFGRRPRLKTGAQVIAELEALRAQKIDIVFIVDDNLIGNKKAVKELLREVIAYQQARDYPFAFFTEASLDLAEDAELLELMADAHIGCVFVGIETPNEKSLKEMKKYQNIRASDTLVERVRRIQAVGIEVWCGMIVGFDNDDASIFVAQREFLREARVATAMIGMLSAIPKTPLHARLAKEGRLDWSDEPECGSNVIPLQMSRTEVQDGYVQLLQELYEPEAYFERLEDLFIRGRLAFGSGVRKYGQRHRWFWLKRWARKLVTALVLYRRVIQGVVEKDLRREYRRRLWRLIRTRPAPELALIYLFKCLMHYHHHTMSRQMAKGQTKVHNTF